MGDSQWFSKADDLYDRIEQAITALRNGNNPEPNGGYEQLLKEYERLIQGITSGVVG